MVLTTVVFVHILRYLSLEIPVSTVNTMEVKGILFVVLSIYK